MFTSKTRTAAVVLALGLLAAGAGALAQRPAPKAAEGPATPQGAAGGQDEKPAADMEAPARADANGDPIPEGALVRLGTTRFRERGVIFTIAYGPDGKTLLSAGFRPSGPFGDGDPVVLWDAATGKPLHQFRWKRQTESARLVAAAYSADGKTVAASFSDPRPGTPFGKTSVSVNVEGAVGRVVLWDAETETELHEIAVGSAGWLPKDPLVLSRDAKTLFTGEPPGHGFPTQEKEGAPRTSFTAGTRRPARNGGGGLGSATAFTLLPCRRTGKSWPRPAKTGGETNGKARSSSGTPPAATRSTPSPPSAGRSTPSLLRRTARPWRSTGRGGAAALWDVESGKRLRELSNTEDEEVFDVAISPDGKTLATAETGGVVRIRDAETGREVRRIKDKGAFVRSLDLRPTARRWRQASAALSSFWT